jgi:Peptidase inhibitor family I36
MHNVLADARNVLLGTVVALAMLAGALLVLAPTASANREDCPAGRICLWSGPTFGGDRAFFEGSATGCHSLANIDPRSGWNHTGNHTAEFPFSRTIGPGASFSNIFPWGGNVCIS